MEESIKKLKKILEARKLNAQYREALTQRLQYINQKIFILSEKTKKSSLSSPFTTLIDLDDDTTETFVRLFWGKIGNKLKESNQQNESGTDEEEKINENENENENQFETFDDHESLDEQINEGDKENKQEIGLKEKCSKLILSNSEKRLAFIEQKLDSRQKSFLFASTNPTASIISFQHFNITPFDVPYSLHDYVRCIFFTKIFGPNFPFKEVYPHISLKKMKKCIEYCKTLEVSRNLSQIEIPEIHFDF